MNTKGKSTSSFGVPYQIWGLWQYLKTLLAQKAYTSSWSFPKVEPLKEWLMEVKRSSKAIRILSPYTTIPCSFRGTTIEALHNSMVETNIMFKFLAEALLGKMPLVSTNKLFKSPLGLIFECCGIDGPNQGFHRFPHLCHPWVRSSHRLSFGKSFPHKTLPREPKWKVGKNYCRHSYLLVQKPHGES